MHSKAIKASNISSFFPWTLSRYEACSLMENLEDAGVLKAKDQVVQSMVPLISTVLNSLEYDVWGNKQSSKWPSPMLLCEITTSHVAKLSLKLLQSVFLQWQVSQRPLNYLSDCIFTFPRIPRHRWRWAKTDTHTQAVRKSLSSKICLISLKNIGIFAIHAVHVYVSVHFWKG